MKTKSAIGIIAFFVGMNLASATSDDLVIFKTTNTPPERAVERFEEIRIAIDYFYDGNDPLHEVFIEDRFQDVYGSIWDIPENCTKSKETLRCELGTLETGAEGTIEFSAQIAGGAPTGMTTIYSIISGKDINENILEQSFISRFWVAEASGQGYFFFDPTTREGESEGSVGAEKEGRTALDRLANNVRPVFTKETTDEPEDEEELALNQKEEIIKEEVKPERKAMGGDESLLTKENSPQIQKEEVRKTRAVSTTPINISGDENLHGAAPENQNSALPNHLSTSGSSAFFLVFIALFATLIIRHNELFRK